MFLMHLHLRCLQGGGHVSVWVESGLGAVVASDGREAQVCLTLTLTLTLTLLMEGRLNCVKLTGVVAFVL